MSINSLNNEDNKLAKRMGIHRKAAESFIRAASIPEIGSTRHISHRVREEEPVVLPVRRRSLGWDD